ncbi:CHAT domain-containing protein [Pseudomonadales bacterium]|nr:CHAT domain-containing protein [Pseudomonadales bacterium]
MTSRIQSITFFLALSVAAQLGITLSHDVNAQDAEAINKLRGEAESALETGDVELALESYLAALALEPENVELLGSLADLASVIGMSDLALDSLVQQANLLVSQGNKAGAREVHEQISAINGQIPEQMAARFAAISEYTEEQASAVENWQIMSSESMAALNSGDVEGAIGAQEAAMLIVSDVFGQSHWFTISAHRDLGFVYRQSGAAEQAEMYYTQALNTAELLLGAEHPNTLEIQELIAELYSAVGLSEEAAFMREMIAGTLEATLGASHQYTISARYGLINGADAAVQHAEALAMREALCTDLESSHGLFHDETLTCLTSLSLAQLSAQILAKAEKSLEMSVGRMAAVKTNIDGALLSSMSHLAEVYHQQGRFQDSANLLSGVIQTALETQNLEVANQAKGYLARLFNSQGKLTEAELITEEVLDYALINWIDKPLNIYNLLLELGAIYQASGKLPDAEATFEEAYHGLLRDFGELHPSTLVSMNNLGQIYEKSGFYDDAEPLLKKTLEKYLATYGEENQNALRARNNLALLHESQGNFREAEPLYQRSLDVMTQLNGENHTDTIAVKNNLAFLYMLMEDFERSAPLFSDVSDRWGNTLGAQHQKTLKANNNLGRVYHKMNRLDEAETVISQTLQIRQDVLGKEHLDSIRSMIDLGAVYLDQGRLPEADQLLTEALALAEKILGTLHNYTFEALNGLADVKEAANQLSSAVDLRDEGFQRRSEFLDRMLWVTGENAREGYIRLHRPEFNDYISLLNKIDSPNRGQKIIDASIQRKGLLLKVTSEIQQIATLSNDPKLRSIAIELEMARKELAARTLSGPTAETKDNHVEVLYGLELKVNELQGQLGRESVRYRTSIAQVSAAALEGVLAEGNALVDFLVYEEEGEAKLVAGVAVKEGDQVRYELVSYDDRKAIEDIIIEYRSIIQDDSADEDELLEIGLFAYELIWQPVQEVLGDSEYVYLIPDGTLNILPFNAIVTEEEEYLIQALDVHILTSARDLLPNQYRLADGQYVVLAGPDYDSEDVVSEEEMSAAQGKRASSLQQGLRGAGSGLRGLNFAPLPGAELEGRIIVDQVAENNVEREVFFGRQAEEQVLLNLDKPPRILHMATHGFFLEADDNLRKRLLKLQRGADLQVPPPGDNPLLRAGLAFAGINTNAQFLGDIDTANDGVLTALEVLGLNLSGTRLVVLSACETGLGEIHEGEGVYGLRRSFQEAGVAEVISSLWEVSDAGTQALMTDFYDRLLGGQPAREALRDAQLALLDSPEWGYPYVWSAFMIVGSYESAGFTVQ